MERAPESKRSSHSKQALSGPHSQQQTNQQSFPQPYQQQYSYQQQPQQAYPQTPQMDQQMCQSRQQRQMYLQTQQQWVVNSKPYNDQFMCCSCRVAANVFAILVLVISAVHAGLDIYIAAVVLALLMLFLSAGQLGVEIYALVDLQLNAVWIGLELGFLSIATIGPLMVIAAHFGIPLAFILQVSSSMQRSEYTWLRTITECFSERKRSKVAPSLNLVERRHLKVVMIGDRRVGKSSVAIQYAQKYFNAKQLPTIANNQILKNDVNTGNEMVNVHIKDIAGQERLGIMSYDSMISAIYHEADCYNWIRFFVAQAGVKPKEFSFMLLGNKIDRKSERAVTYERAISWCKSNNIMLYFETSAKQDINVEDAFSSIILKTVEQWNTKTRISNTLLKF
uniref:Uncharacterized protein n=1 Tax=Ditylenchus dipsaci TaxID=166011 RepID=A0A915D805_9BILA